MNQYMKKLVKSTLLSTTTSILLLSTPLATAELLGNNIDNGQAVSETYNDVNHHHRYKKKMLKKMARHLDLDETQQAAIKTIMSNARQDRETKRVELESFRQQLTTLMSAEIFDEQAYISLREQYHASFDQMALTKVKSKHAISRVLTVEQRNKWQKLKEKMKSRRRGHAS